MPSVGPSHWSAVGNLPVIRVVTIYWLRETVRRIYGTVRIHINETEEKGVRLILLNNASADRRSLPLAGPRGQYAADEGFRRKRIVI